MAEFYSQSGEDRFCCQLLDGCIDGFFVDVGALDGKHLSNTFALELLGWKGICIEPHNFFFNCLLKNRPKSICVNAAVSNYNKDDIDFATNYYGTLSTLCPQKYEKLFSTRFKTRFRNFENQKINVRTLNTIFQDHKVKKIDVLLIDVEGEELQVLYGLNIQLYKPRIIIAEYFNEQKKKELIDFMAKNNYWMAKVIRANLVFVSRKEDYDKAIKIQVNQQELIHTGNPRD